MWFLAVKRKLSRKKANVSCETYVEQAFCEEKLLLNLIILACFLNTKNPRILEDVIQIIMRVPIQLR